MSTTDKPTPGIYKCYYNCAGGMKVYVPPQTPDNADYCNRLTEFNQTKRFCGMGYPGDSGNDAFKQRYCTRFEPRDARLGDYFRKGEATS